MKNQISIFIFLSFFLFAVIFLGNSITGYVISQSCCFAPHCSEENLCKLSVSENNNIFLDNIFASIFIITISVYGIHVWRKNHSTW